MKISAAFSTFGMWIPAAWVLIQYRRRLRESTVCARNLRYSIIFQCLILLLSAACRRHRRMAACMCLPYLAVDK
jgi:hypothetical protein